LIIALIVINWLVEWNFKAKIVRIRKDKYRRYNLYFAIIYLLYVIGLLNTNNFKYGLFDLEVKLSLLLFPIIFSTLPEDIFNRKAINYLLISWLSGNFLATMICLVGSIYRYTESQNYAEFYYSHLSVLLHPGYFSMYLNLSMILIISKLFIYRDQVSKPEKYLYSILAVWFFIFIILLSSKAGIISVGLVFLAFIIYYLITTRKILKSFSFLVMVVIIFVLISQIFPRSFGRMEKAREVITNSENIENDTKEGTAERILIWKASISIIKANFIMGLGTGDVKDGLLEIYNKKGYITAQERSLNSHNQFLQTFISLGILGFLVLSLSLIIPLIYSVKMNDVVYLIFLSIIVFNFMVESMLERQAGVIFYAFFNSYFFIIKKRP
jgi:O-antigen ligase